MTTTLDSPVIGEPASQPSAADLSPAELRDLEGRLDRRSDRRDNWTAMMLMVAFIALIFSVIAVGFGVRAIDQSKHNVKTAVAPAAAAPVATPVAPTPAVLTSVSLADMTVTPSATAVAPGKYNVVITNNGKMAHELLVFHTDTAASDLPIGADGKAAEDAPGFKISDGDNLDPGASQSRVIDLTEPGTYLFVCNLPGHLMAGMHAVVTVK
ncbi:MAG: plastocyanin/azurin family copper-binding protein [Actinomycetota bacterium]|nr:plastocyanin/azurin family copper-binding protein [Actinomycetota bacterium]